jgi:hypothetical protein
MDKLGKQGTTVILHICKQMEMAKQQKWPRLAVHHTSFLLVKHQFTTLP